MTGRRQVSACRRASEVEQHLAELARRLQAVERSRGFLGRKHAIDERGEHVRSRDAVRPRGRTTEPRRPSPRAAGRGAPCPSRRARRPISFRRSSGASVPPPVPTITIRPLTASARRSGSRLGAPTSSRMTSAPPSARARSTRSSGAITVAPSAATSSRSAPCERSRARGHPRRRRSALRPCRHRRSRR